MDLLDTDTATKILQSVANTCGQVMTILRLYTHSTPSTIGRHPAAIDLRSGVEADIPLRLGFPAFLRSATGGNQRHVWVFWVCQLARSHHWLPADVDRRGG